MLQLSQWILIFWKISVASHARVVDLQIWIRQLALGVELVSILANWEWIYYHCIHVEGCKSKDLINSYFVCHINCCTDRLCRISEPVSQYWLQLTVHDSDNLCDVVRLRKDNHECEIDQEKETEEGQKMHSELIAHR